MRTILVLSDLHSGHLVGLTPPAWWLSDSPDLPRQKRKSRKAEVACWEWFEAALKKVGPISDLLLGGDLVDGRGERSGSTELLTADREEQCTMAEYVIRRAATKETQIRGVYGTPYHVSGGGEDWENYVCDTLRAEGYDIKFGSHEWYDFDGVIVDLKHHVGSSTIPHGRATPVAKEKLWNHCWSARGEAPDADLILRGHVHSYIKVETSDWTAISLPALQGYGSKYGARRCSGTVDFGFVVIRVDNGRFQVEPYIARLPEFRAVAEVL